jgi:signal transduction histidine kinase
VTTRRWGLIVLAAAALYWAFGAEWVSIHQGVVENHFLDAMPGVSFLVAGVIAMDRRPGNRVGALMLAASVSYFSANWMNLRWGWLIPLLSVGASFGPALFAHLVLSYPSGRLATTFERVTVAAAYLTFVGSAVGSALTFDPVEAGCYTCPQIPVPLPNGRASVFFGWVGDHSAFVLVPMFLAALLIRSWRASPVGRRDLVLALLSLAAAIVALEYLYESYVADDTSWEFGYLLWEVSTVLTICVPVLVLFGLLSSRLAQGSIGNLVVDLQAPLARGQLRALLARTLGDPSVDIVYAIEGTHRWVDADGIPATLPAPEDHKRRHTMVERDNRPLAALVHDPALDPALVRATGAAAGMAIENERLHAEVRAQLDEVRSSRARLVQAGDDERRRLERDLHDGAQQRLLTLAIALRRADRQLACGEPAELAGTLAGASRELRAAIDELRELARGIHPTVLTEAGLGPALRSLGERAGVPVLVEAIDQRFPPTVEATAFFVASEALANTTKYAKASSAELCARCQDGILTVEISDDGVGGADPDVGSGLRGLQDRVAAAGGRLTVTSPLGAGTVVRADLPCREEAQP